MFAVVAAVVEILFFYDSLTSWLNEAPVLWSVWRFITASVQTEANISGFDTLVRVIFISVLGNTKPQ